MMEVASKTLSLLVIHGLLDSQISGPKLVETLQPSFGERLRVNLMEGVGHSPFLEAPEQFRKSLVEFVHEVTGTMSLQQRGPMDWVLTRL